MKLFTIILLLSNISIASEFCDSKTDSETIEGQLEISTDVPKHLVGATITVTTKDGKTSTVPAEKFKVVPRKQQFIVNKTKERSSTVCKVTEEGYKNRVSLLAGKGMKSGLDTERTIDEVTVKNRIGVVGGAQYQRKLNERWNLGIQAQTNKSYFGSVGFDF